MVHEVDGVGGAAGAEFGVDGFFAGFDGVFADAELGGDGAGFEAEADEVEDLCLAGGEWVVVVMGLSGFVTHVSGSGRESNVTDFKGF